VFVRYGRSISPNTPTSRLASVTSDPIEPLRPTLRSVSSSRPGGPPSPDKAVHFARLLNVREITDSEPESTSSGTDASSSSDGSSTEGEPDILRAQTHRSRHIREATRTAPVTAPLLKSIPPASPSSSPPQAHAPTLSDSVPVVLEDCHGCGRAVAWDELSQAEVYICPACDALPKTAQEEWERFVTSQVELAGEERDVETSPLGRRFVELRVRASTAELQMRVVEGDRAMLSRRLAEMTAARDEAVVTREEMARRRDAEFHELEVKLAFVVSQFWSLTSAMLGATRSSADLVTDAQKSVRAALAASPPPR